MEKDEIEQCLNAAYTAFEACERDEQQRVKRECALRNVLLGSKGEERHADQSSIESLLEASKHIDSSSDKEKLTFSQFYVLYKSWRQYEALHQHPQRKHEPWMGSGFSSFFPIYQQHFYEDRSKNAETQRFLEHYDANYYDSVRPLTTLEDFVAGTFGGIALTVVGHPFDTVKVRLQSNAAFSSPVEVMRKTISSEGVLGLWKGMASPLSTIPLLNAIVFAAYGQAKAVLKPGEDESMSILQGSLAGAYAGLVNSIIVNPVEILKTRLQIQYTADAPLKGPWDAARLVVQQEGLRGLFRGMSSMICRETTGYAGQFAAYELIKQGLIPEDGSEDDLGYGQLMLAGGLAGVSAWIFSYPFDYCKTQLVTHPPGTFPRHRWIPDGGFIQCYRQTVRTKGHAAIWKGFTPCIARAFPANAAGFLTYEIASKVLRSL